MANSKGARAQEAAQAFLSGRFKEWTEGAPVSTRIDESTGRGYPTTFYANKKGVHHRAVGGSLFHREQQEVLGADRALSVHPRAVYWELRGKEEKARKTVAKAERVNLEVLSFGWKGHARKEGGAEEEEEEEGGTARGRGRVTSSLFWDKGPMTSDASFAAIQQVAEEKQQAAEVSEKRKREQAAKEMERSAKYYKLAEGAREKLGRELNHVLHSKLVKDELVSMLRGMGHTPATNTRKSDLENQLQELLGMPGRSGPWGYIV
ncbi:hypothetical protein CYMTET_3494 [Cymbomonas tetramitiformis]|uniref:Uncharacterized protein n=1 Tax=Cymbomonas tetramitiformis TaxID=36881 RepID=A0AAE0LLB3_9CHLO|nr:hypothetical protein CYMTET_3494 [Cymbomonas tetramitiformis]